MPDTKTNYGLVEVIGRALVDKTVREQLLTDPKGLAEQYGLTDKDANALAHINRRDLEDAASRFSNHTDWVIGIGIHGHFDTK